MAVRRRLRWLAAGILAAMLWLTVAAALDRDVFTALGALWPDPWFRATMADAYFGFLIFYLWVWYKEAGMSARITWFVLIMLLGNFAMAAYLLRESARLAPDDGPDRLLLRRPA